MITKLDVLSGFDQIKIVRGYRRGGVLLGFGAVDDRPLALEIATLPGWQEDIRGIRHIRDLPANARAYLPDVRQWERLDISAFTAQTILKACIPLPAPLRCNSRIRNQAANFLRMDLCHRCRPAGSARDVPLDHAIDRPNFSSHVFRHVNVRRRRVSVGFDITSIPSL